VFTHLAVDDIDPVFLAACLEEEVRTTLGVYATVESSTAATSYLEFTGFGGTSICHDIVSSAKTVKIVVYSNSFVPPKTFLFTFDFLSTSGTYKTIMTSELISYSPEAARIKGDNVIFAGGASTGEGPLNFVTMQGFVSAHGPDFPVSTRNTDSQSFNALQFTPQNAFVEAGSNFNEIPFASSIATESSIVDQDFETIISGSPLIYNLFFELRPLTLPPITYAIASGPLEVEINPFFIDPDCGESRTYTLELDGGDPLPDFITFADTPVPTITIETDDSSLMGSYLV